MTALVDAAGPGWPVRRDHCFLQIAYDNAVGVRWDTVVSPPAWANLSEAALAEALSLLGAMTDRETLCRLNGRSLALRGKSR